MSQVVAYRFGHCQVDLQRRVVIIGSQDRRVGSKIFDLLVALIQNRHRMVTRDELAKVGWRNGFVSDAALSRAITRCRQAIDDDSAAQPRIRAQWGQGYHFQGDVEVSYACPMAAASPMAIAVADAGGPPLALLPVVRADSGQADAQTAALGVELALRLARDGHARLCPADRVRELLQQLGSTDPLTQLRHLWCHLGSITVLAVETSVGSERWAGSARLYGPDGSVVQGQDVDGADVENLADKLVTAIARYLPTRAHPQTPVDLPDAFAVEAYLRAAGAADQWRWHQAQRLAMVVCDQAPESLSAQMLLLRTLLHTHSRAAIGVGERLLEHARNRVAPEYLASIHIALGQSLQRQPDVDSHADAHSHLEAAVALADGKPPELWAVRAHLALAARCMLGDQGSREQARLLLVRAANLADQCGHAFMAAAARSNLAYLLHHDGHVERSLRLHEDLLQQAESRGLDVPRAFALTIKAELVRAWGQLSVAQGWLDLGWGALARVPQDERAEAGAFLAYVQTALALDRGCVEGVTRAARVAPYIEQCHPRHRVHLAIALGRAAFVDGCWELCLDWLAKAGRIAETHQLHQMCCPALVMTVQLGMAAGDHGVVSRAVDRLDALSDTQKRVGTEAEAIRARAWLALADGQVHTALRLLMPIALSAHEAYSVYLARLDAAWLALRQCSPERASELLALCAHWPDQSPVGALTAMAVSLAHARPAEARERLSLVKTLWRGPWPCAWTSPEAVVNQLGDQLPSHALLGMMMGAQQPQRLTSDRAA